MFLSCYVRIQSESTLYSCLNVKEILVRSRREIWSLNECNCKSLSDLTSDFAPVSSKEFSDIQATTECGITLNVYVTW